MVKSNSRKTSSRIIFNLIVVSLFMSFWSCSEKEKVNTPEILYEDQVNLKIDDKYFTVQIDTLESTFFNVKYRIDISSIQLYRYWLRSYNEMFEIRFFNRDVFNVEKKGYNYLFGIKSFGSDSYKAFYIRWRNEPINSDSSKAHGNIFITSDISESTVEIQSNLPPEIIEKYYPRIKCPIETIEMPRAKIKLVQIGKILSSNYQPIDN